MRQEIIPAYISRKLSAKEELIVKLVAQGMKNTEIYPLVGFRSVHVLKNYMQVIFDKTGMCSRLELAIWWLRREQEEGRSICEE